MVGVDSGHDRAGGRGEAVAAVHVLDARRLGGRGVGQRPPTVGRAGLLPVDVATEGDRADVVRRQHRGKLGALGVVCRLGLEAPAGGEVRRAGRDTARCRGADPAPLLDPGLHLEGGVLRTDNALLDEDGVAEDATTLRLDAGQLRTAVDRPGAKRTW